MMPSLIHCVICTSLWKKMQLLKKLTRSKRNMKFLWNFRSKSQSFKVSSMKRIKRKKQKRIKRKKQKLESVHVARKSGQDNSVKILRNDSPCSAEHNEMTIRHLHSDFKDLCKRSRSKGRVCSQFLVVQAEKSMISS